MTLTVSVVSTARTWARPARNARMEWSERASCIITLQNAQGVRGRGEAAPLPGFSPDDLRDCEQALLALDVSGIAERLEPTQDLIGELRRASARIPPQLPAARAALETALLDLWARAAFLPAWALLGPAAPVPAARSVAALISGQPEDAVAQALAARARGIGTFKIKIGRAGALSRELAAVRALRAALGPSARLRLDANQSLSAAEARDYLPRFASCGLEFIEEPCAAHELAALRDLGLPLALDESLAAGARPMPGDRALILKPTLLAGITGCFALAEAARAVGAQVVVSHAFEGPLGLALSAALALSIGSHTFAHGLDLAGANIDPQCLPYFAQGEVQPWSEPGFGIEELG